MEKEVSLGARPLNPWIDRNEDGTALFRPEIFQEERDRFLAAVKRGETGDYPDIIALGLHYLAALKIAGPGLYEETNALLRPDEDTVNTLFQNLDAGNYQNNPDLPIRERSLDMELSRIGLYYVGLLTHVQIGTLQNTSRQAIEQNIKKGMRDLSRGTSEQVAGISYKERGRLLSSREKHSRANGGVSISVREGLAKGLSTAQIQAEYDLNTDQVAKAYNTLHKWGVEVPPPSRGTRSLTERVAVVSRLMNRGGNKIAWADRLAHQVSPNTNQRGLEKLTTGGNPAYVKLRDAVIATGKHYNMRNSSVVADLLRSQGIYVSVFERAYIDPSDKESTFRYYLVPTPLAPVVAEAITNAIAQNPKTEALFKNPVELFAGPPTDSIPSTNDLLKTDQYQSVKSALVSFDSKRRIDHADLLADCPIGIFRYIKTAGYYYNISDEAALKSHIEQFVGKNGLLKT